MRRMLMALSARLPVRIISDNGQPYLERYFLAECLGVRMYLHRFVGSDPDRGLHDHPWRWAFSLILAGWYIEERRDGDHMRSRFNALTADTFHRVVLPVGARDCWTLFIHRARDVKPWGFLRTFDDGTAIWVKYAYDGATKDPHWERTAPTGRACTQRMEG